MISSFALMIAMKTVTAVNPKPGLFFQAAAKYPDIDLSKSPMFGDKDTDREAAEAAGCGILLYG